MYVLTFYDRPLACAEREERLNEQMANYTAAEQGQMAIVEVELLE